MKKVIYALIAVVQIAAAMDHVPSIFKNIPRQVQDYLNDLPAIKLPNDCNNPKEKAKVITDYLLKMGGYDESVDGREIIEKKILAYITKDEPIQMLMPAFPASSGNPDKIPFDDQHSFGLGDLVALLTQNHISEEIKKVHAPGSSLAIYWEPFINDINVKAEEKFGVSLFSKERIRWYQNTLKRFIKYLEPNMVIGSLPEGKSLDEVFDKKYRKLEIKIEEKNILNDYKIFFKKEIDTPAINNAVGKRVLEGVEKQLLVKNPWIKNKTFEEIKNDKNFKKLETLFSGIKKYKEKAIDEIAEEILVGSKRMALMLENEIPHYKEKIRMSVRPDKKSVKNKLGTALIFGSNGTPWHNVLVVGDSGLKLMHYDDLIKIAKKNNKEPQKKSYIVGNRKLFYFESN